MNNRTSLAALTIGALGVVYGDLGTSPLYAFNEVFFGGGGLAIEAANAAGAASLIFWFMALVIGIKYAILVLRADNDSEGGVFALFSLIQRYDGRHIMPLSFLLMFAAGLLFGEGIITPAISVLSAVEGLKLIDPWFAFWVVPVTVAILAAVFYFQKKGTGRLGYIYGPIMLLWFLSLAVLGLKQIVMFPQIIGMVVNPLTAVDLALSLDWRGFMMVAGAAFLALTGCEALYADLGHFGRRAIRYGWFFIVFPALALNYAGQAAFIMRGQEVSANNLFYSLVPGAFLPFMVFLATAATVIASVALIFGAYSLVSQAMAMHLLPRFAVVHTSRLTEGQIYLPAVNWALFSGSVALVLAFGSSARLAAAYGFAVSGVMLVTTLSMAVIAFQHWKWPAWMVASVFGFFGILDFYFIFANSSKFFEGGYIPFLLGCAIFTVIATWRWGWRLLMQAHDSYSEDRNIQWFLDLKRRVAEAGGILDKYRARNMVQSDRAAVFITAHPITSTKNRIPVKLRMYLKRYGTIPRDVLLFNIEQVRIPYVKRHYNIIDLGQNVFAVHVRFGFMEDPNAARVLREIYRDHVIEEKFRRCTIEVSEYEFIIENNLNWFRRFQANFFRRLYLWSVPPYRFLGLTGQAAAGLSKIIVPLRFNIRGVRIETPEFPLTSRDDRIDPDTLRPDERRFIKI